MSEEPTASALRRILVALDASPHSRAALDAAVRLASICGAEVEGLFVQDETLLRAAQLPFAKEVRAYTAPPKRLDDTRMRRQLRYQAQYAEHTLQRAARQAEVPHEFRTVEGDVTRELLRAATDVDLVVLGKTSTASSRRRLGGTSQSVFADAPSSVLVLRKPLPSRRPVVLYYDGSPSARAALTLATELAHGTEDTPLLTLLPEADEADLASLRREVRAACEELGVPVQFRSLTPAESGRLSAFTREKDGLVVLPAGCSPLHGAPLQQFLYELDRPVLVAREHAPASSPDSSPNRSQSTMESAPIAQLALTSEADAKLTPLEVLADFADATRGWIYLERASRHYADQKGRPGLVLRHRREGAPPHVDFAFAAPSDDSDEVRLVILDAPDVEEPLSSEQHALLLETFLEALRDYLAARPDHVKLHVEREGEQPAS